MTPAELRNIRQALHETQAGLAARLGVTLATVQKWEAGKHRIPGPVAKLLTLLTAETNSED